MIRPLLLAYIFSLVPVVVGSVSCYGQSPRERLVAEFPAAVAANDQLIDQVRASATFCDYSYGVTSDETLADSLAHPDKYPASRDLSGGELTEAYSLSFELDGQLKRRTKSYFVNKVRTRTPPFKFVDQQPNSLEDTICLGQESSFRIVKRTAGESPVLAEFNMGRDAKLESRISVDASRLMKMIVRPPYLREGKYIGSSDFVVKDVTAVEGSGDSLLRVEFEVKYDDPASKKTVGPNTVRSGWFVVKPDDGWLIQEASVSMTSKKQIFYMKAIYGEKAGRIRLPKTLYLTTAFGRQEVVFETISFEPSPAADFTPAAFGFPDIKDAPATTQARHFPYWLIATGTLILALAVGLRFFVQRRTLT